MLLGEAASKCEHIANVPLRPSTAEELNKLYLAKGALATTAIEGNTLSEEEVVQHLEGKLRLPPSKEYLAKEIDNIVAGCNHITAQIRTGQSLSLRVATIKEFNRLVLKELAFPDGVVPGEIRAHSVGVARYRGAPAEDCEYLLARMCEWLNGADFQPPPGTPDLQVAYAVIKAVLAHLYIAWIHPFGDGNGRTARLIELQLLLTSGVPTPAAHLLSNHYNQTRAEYYRQLDQASQSGDALPFLNYAVRGFADGLRSQLGLIREQQWDVTWENYVHENFRDRGSPSNERRRHLVLDLSDQGEPVPLNKLHEVTARVAKAYAHKTSKTVSRDLRALLDMGLVRVEGKGVVANKEVILAFLPLRRDPTTKRRDRSEGG